MRLVRTGITRTVVLVGRWAIKVPSLRGAALKGPRGRAASFAAGWLANQSEYLWSSYEDWQGLIAPVKHSWLLGLIQVYPRCEPLPVGSSLPRLIPDPGDNKLDNFGFLGGRAVRLDYAMS